MFRNALRRTQIQRGKVADMPKVRLREELRKRAVYHGNRTDHDRKVTWLELFSDLAMVAALGQLGGSIASNFTLQSLGIGIAMFIAVWWVWVGETFYLNRFDAEDLPARLKTMLIIVMVVLWAVVMPGALEGHLRAFIIIYLSLRFALVMRYRRIGIVLPEVKKLAEVYTRGFGLGMIPWAISMFVPTPFALILWAVGMAWDASIPSRCRQLQIDFPPDFHHFPERFGLFTIIVLGEGILAAVNGLNYATMSNPQLLISVVGVFVFCAFWWLYFEGVRATEVAKPKDSAEVKRTMNWLYAHMPLMLGIILSAVSWKLAIKYWDVGLPLEVKVLSAVSVALVQLCFHYIWLNAVHWEYRKIAWKLSWPHLVITAITVLGAILSLWLPAAFVLLICAATTLSHVVTVMVERPDLIRLQDASKRADAGEPHELSIFG
jgi:low temperature requirement protein LtrA